MAVLDTGDGDGNGGIGLGFLKVEVGSEGCHGGGDHGRGQIHHQSLCGGAGLVVGCIGAECGNRVTAIGEGTKRTACGGSSGSVDGPITVSIHGCLVGRTVDDQGQGAAGFGGAGDGGRYLVGQGA